MIPRILSFAIALSSLFLILCACSSESVKEQEYIAIYKRDTAYLKLQLYDHSYHGTLQIHSSQYKESGKVQGKIIGDTLMGDFLYTPYKAKLEKRRALVFKRNADSLIQGIGLEQIFMGIPHYDPSSIHFDSARFVFQPLAL